MITKREILEAIGDLSNDQVGLAIRISDIEERLKRLEKRNKKTKKEGGEKRKPGRPRKNA